MGFIFHFLLRERMVKKSTLEDTRRHPQSCYLKINQEDSTHAFQHQQGEEPRERWGKPVVHLPQLGSGPGVPHADQSLVSTAHYLPIVRLHRRDTQVVGVQRDH